MKKLIVAAVIITSLGLTQNANAQVSININIGSQPAWGPVGYDYARYYYLPEANAYYDVNAARFMYLQRGRWITARRLPSSYDRINLYNTYKVVMNRGYAPYRDNRRDVVHYGRYRNAHSPVVIRDSRNYRYYESRYHPKHKEWKGRRYDKHDKYDNHRDHGKRGRR